MDAWCEWNGIIRHVVTVVVKMTDERHHNVNDQRVDGLVDRKGHHNGEHQVDHVRPDHLILEIAHFFCSPGIRAYVIADL